MTTIALPNNGYNVGTCGWLAAGLRDGSITIITGSAMSGKGGLWLKVGDKSHCLALFNEFGLHDRDSQRFAVCYEDFCGSVPLTQAAESYLRQAVIDWCDKANRDREQHGNNDLPKIEIKDKHG